MVGAMVGPEGTRVGTLIVLGALVVGAAVSNVGDRVGNLDKTDGTRVGVQEGRAAGGGDVGVPGDVEEATLGRGDGAAVGI